VCVGLIKDKLRNICSTGKAPVKEKRQATNAESVEYGIDTSTICK